MHKIMTNRVVNIMTFNNSSVPKLSKHPGHSMTDSNGLQHNVYVMYHANRRHNVPGFLPNSFKPSTG